MLDDDGVSRAADDAADDERAAAIRLPGDALRAGPRRDGERAHLPGAIEDVELVAAPARDEAVLTQAGRGLGVGAPGGSTSVAKAGRPVVRDEGELEMAS